MTDPFTPAAGSITPTPSVVGPIRRAFYIKLGRAGEWAPRSIAEGRVRFGWTNIPLEEIAGGAWDTIRQRLAYPGRTPNVITNDTARLRDLATSTAEDVWVTFHDSHLYWCRMADGPVEADDVSRFRRVAGAWSRTDVHGRPLLANQIPGQLAAMQGYRATVCRVRADRALARLLAGEPSPRAVAVEAAQAALVAAVERALAPLHWRDFETLVDLLFRQAGWRRHSLLGETMKYADLELEEPVTGDRYQVQVKASATVVDCQRYEAQFTAGAFRRLYFVVHSPDAALARYTPRNPAVELWGPARLAEMIVRHGLTGWLVDRVR